MSSVQGRNPKELSVIASSQETVAINTSGTSVIYLTGNNS